jgi:hypothetical protein
MQNNKSQYLRKIPINPVVFSYNSSTDSTPVVLVLKLLHEEKNPGFLGINLSYVYPTVRAKVLETYYMYEDKNRAGEEILHLTKDAIRRYNYENIGFFIYRGTIQDHNLVLTNANFN